MSGVEIFCPECGVQIVVIPRVLSLTRLDPEAFEVCFEPFHFDHTCPRRAR